MRSDATDIFGRSSDRGPGLFAKRGLVLALGWLLIAVQAAPQYACSEYAVGGTTMTVHALENGCRVVAIPMEDGTKGKPSVSVALMAGGGRPADAPEGLAHLVEHMVGTALAGVFSPHPQNPFFFAEVSALTTHERTLYTVECKEGAFMPAAIGILRNTLFAPPLSAERLHSEKGVVEAEYFLNGCTDTDEAMNMVAHCTDEAGGMGVKATGTRKSLSSVSVEDVEAFVKKHYSVSGAVVCVRGPVAGDFLNDAVQTCIEAFSAVAPSAPPADAKGDVREEDAGEGAECNPAVAARPGLQPGWKSPVREEVRGKMQVVRPALAGEGGVFRRALFVNVFCPPPDTFASEVALEIINKILFEALGQRQPSLLRGLGDLACRVAPQVPPRYFFSYFGFSLAPISAQILLTDRGASDIGSVVEIVGEYLGHVKELLEEHLDMFAKVLVELVSEQAQDLAKSLQDSQMSILYLSRLLQRKGGLEQIGRRVDAEEEEAEPSCPKRRRVSSGTESEIREYVAKVLAVLDNGACRAFATLSPDGPFTREIPHIRNNMSRTEGVPAAKLSAERRAGAREAMRKDFLWEFSAAEDGRPLLCGKQDKSAGMQESMLAGARVSPLPSAAAFASELRQLPAAEKEGYQWTSGASKTQAKVLTTGAVLRSLVYNLSYDSAEAREAQRRWSVLFHTRALQASADAAAGAAVHLVAALERFLLGSGSLFDRARTFGYEINADGNVCVRASCPGAGVNHAQLALELFLGAYEADSAFSEAELDAARNIFRSGVIDAQSRKTQFQFDRARMHTALLSAHVPVPAMLAALERQTAAGVAGHHCAAFQSAFEQFSSFREVHGLRTRLQAAFRIVETARLAAIERMLCSLWDVARSQEGGKFMEVHVEGLNARVRHVLYAIPLPLTEGVQLEVFRDYCHMVQDYFEMHFMRPRMDVYVCQLRVQRISERPDGWALCAEVSGTTPSGEIVEGIREFLPSGAAMYVGTVFPESLPMLAGDARAAAALVQLVCTTTMPAVVVVEGPAAGRVQMARGRR